ncbi:MAG: hypothetical protein IT330_01075 [Anaerolineae bacterium]|nr:hypothetical protein [Anaerolineae bacterium]
MKRAPPTSSPVEILRPIPGTTWWNAAVVAVAMSAITLVFTPPLADPDLWGHVRFGLDLWQTGQIIRSDPYSYLTAGQPWINHEWLAEAIYGLLYSRWGPPGLTLFNVGISLLMVGLLYRHLYRLRLHPITAGLLLGFFSLLLRPGVLNIRPQVFTYFLFLLILLLIYAAEHGSPQRLWGAIPIMAVWANLHGGFLAGLGIFLLWGFVYLALRVWHERWLQAPVARPHRFILLIVIAGPLATLLNPYGVGLVTFLLRTATVPRPEIAEWQPIDFRSTWGTLYLTASFLTVIGIVLTRRPRRPTLMVLLAVIAILPLAAARHTPLFALAAVAFAGEHIGDAAERWVPRRLLNRLVARVPSRRGAALLCGVLLVLHSLAVPRLRHIQIEPGSSDVPVRAVALLKASDVGGNMVVDFNWGEYAIWHLGPRIKVSIDGRRETVYADEVYGANLRFMFGEGDWDALLREHGTELALVKRARPAFDLMASRSGWVLVYDDPLCGLFVQEESPLLEQIRQTPIPPLPYGGKGLSFP